jgi:hypothetical protein
MYTSRYYSWFWFGEYSKDLGRTMTRTFDVNPCPLSEFIMTKLFAIKIYNCRCVVNMIPPLKSYTPAHPGKGSKSINPRPTQV